VSRRVDLTWLAFVLLLLEAALLLMCETMNTARAETQADKVVVDPVGLTLSEPWATDRFTLTLTSQPDATVFITLTASSSECMVLPTVLGLDAGTWATGVMATVTVVDDAIVDGSQICWIQTGKSQSEDAAFDGLNPRDVKVTVLDDDVAGVVVNPEFLSVSEPSGSASFSVALTSQPTQVVSVSLVSTATEQCEVSPASVGLDATNWPDGVTATVTAVDDAITDGSQRCVIQTGPAVSEDLVYNDLDPEDVTVTVLDDEQGIVVTPIELTLSEPGEAGVFSMTLTGQPMEVVSVSLVSTATEQCEVSPASVGLDATNWADGVTATVTAVDDAIADGSQRCVIQTGPAVSGDLVYNDLDPEDVTVTVLDDDERGIVVTPVGLTLSEPDEAGVLTVTLSSQPTQVVSVSLVSTATGQCEVSPASLGLDATNWADGVTATVTAVDDAIADGSQRCVIQTGPTVSEDLVYNGLDPEDVTVTVLDNETVMRLYMPVVMQRWLPVLDSPALAPIENVDGDGAYSISWSSVSGAVLYILEESSNAMFSDVREISVDSHTSYAVTQRGAGRYHYRVKARNQWSDSGWSASQYVDVLWEAEPNDLAQTEANGPLVSGLIYYGAFPSETDRQDYYYIDLFVAHSVELWLTNIPAEHNYDLVLRDASLKDIEYSGALDNASEHILTGLLPPGRYYIQVYHRSSGGSAEPYHLSTTFE
jgi:hypothetical protein